MFTDESGEFFFVAALIGAAVSVLTNGISNIVHNQPFFHGAGMAAITGFIGGGLSFGIGEIAKTMSGFGKFAFQTLAHAHLGGMMSAMSGGSYGIGALSGGLGSMAGSGMGKLLKGASSTGLFFGQVGAGAMMGGISSSIAGGNFWDGFRNGAISSGLNHFAHELAYGLKFKNEVKSAYGDKINKPAPKNIETVKDVISKIPTLNNLSQVFGNIPMDVNPANTGGGDAEAVTWPQNETINSAPAITFYGDSFSSYLHLAQVIYHEYMHVNDYFMGTFNNDYLKYKAKYGKYSGYKITVALSEIRAYQYGYWVTGAELGYGYIQAARYLDLIGINY